MTAAREVVLLHGWGVTSRIWRELCAGIAPLSGRAVNLPGYAGEPACEPATLAGIADAVARAAPDRCDVVGWSLGGMVALDWARAAPAQVRRLVLIAATPSFGARQDWPEGVAADVLAAFEREVRSDRDRALRRFALLQAHGDADAKLVASRLLACLATDGSVADAVLADGLRVLREADLRKSLAAVRQPVLLLHGEGDGLVPIAAARRLAAQLPECRLLAVAGCGHAPFLARPAQCAQWIREFLDG